MENKAKGSFITLIAVLAILLVGYYTLSTVNNSIDGVNDNFNATVMMSNTVYNIVGLVIIVGVIIAMVGLAIFYVSTPERYKKANTILYKILSFLDSTTYYFAFGLLAVAIFSVPAILGYVLLQVISYAGESGVGIEIGKWIGIVLLVYFGVAGIGYIFKHKIYDKWKKRKSEGNKVEYKENMKLLPGLIK